MENPAHVFTTGIPISTKGNGDHSYNGSIDGEVLKPCLDEESIDSSIKCETITLIPGTSDENGSCFNPSIQDGDQCELLYNIVCGTGLRIGDIRSLSVSSPQSTVCEDGVFTDRIQCISSDDIVVENMDGPIGYTLSVPDFKLSKCSEEQKKVNETISAIAKSFGLDDFIPEPIQDEDDKDLFTSSVENVQKNKNNELVDNYDKSAVELHIPDSPMQFAADSDLLDTYSQESILPLRKKCDDFDSGLLMRLPLIMKDGSTRYVIGSKDDIKQYTSCKVEDDNDELCEIINDPSVGCVLETVASEIVCQDEEQKSCPEGPAAVIEAGASDLLTETLKETLNSGVTEPATISVSADSANRKMQIIFTTSQGQQMFEIDTDDLALEPAPSFSKGVVAETVKLVQDKLQPSQTIANGNLGAPQDEEEEIQYEEELAKFMKKISTSRGKPKQFACPVENCGVVLEKECKLRVHMISHKAPRPFKCDIDGCNWAFSTLYRLKRHCETHFGRKNFACDFEGCNRKFTTVYNLKSHQKRHIWPVSLLCPAEGCDMSFANRRKLELHLKVHDDIEAPYKCSTCGKTYYSANCIASHYRTHQYSEDDFKCPFAGCKKKYDKICRLKQHLRHHTGERPYACPAAGCKWSFMSASKLTRHMRKHTGERKFVCSECGKSFMRPEHLKGHVVIHSGDKPFQCPHENCNARFTAKSSLYVHVKKHTASGLKIVYVCPVTPCIKKYNNKATLKQHIQKAHPNVLKEGKTIEMAEQVELTVPVPLNATHQNGGNMNATVCSIPVSLQQSVSELETVLPNTSMPIFITSRTDKTPAGSISITSVENLEKVRDDVSSGLRFVTPNSLEQSLSPKLYSSSSEMDLASPKLLHRNTSGSARTDYCCARTNEKKTWPSAYNRVRGSAFSSNTSESQSLDSNSTLNSAAQNSIPSSPDVLLMTSSMVFQDSSCEQLTQTAFLHDEPSSTDIYQDDSMLVNNSTFGSDLPMSSSFLSDDSNSNSSAIVRDSSGAGFGTSAAVDEFPEAVIEYCLS